MYSEPFCWRSATQAHFLTTHRQAPLRPRHLQAINREARRVPTRILRSLVSSNSTGTKAARDFYPIFSCGTAAATRASSVNSPMWPSSPFPAKGRGFFFCCGGYTVTASLRIGRGSSAPIEERSKLDERSFTRDMESGRSGACVSSNLSRVGH